MKTPTLHHARADHWMVGEYPLGLRKDKEGWRVMSLIAGLGHDWLLQSGLFTQRFRTRKEALEALMDAVEVCPGMEERPAAPCKRIGPGRYRLAGGMEAVRNGPGWKVMDGEKLTGSALNLRQAARLARLRLDRADIFVDW